MVFFVLSGFVIAYTAEHEPIPSVFITARLARLWSVVIPALVLTLAADKIGNLINHDFYTAASYDGGLPALRLIASGLFLNEVWLWSICPLSNLPFWSIGYEFWYYLLFAAGFYLSGLRRTATIAVAAVIVGPKVLLLLPIWLLGVAVYRFNNKAKVSEVAGWLMFLSPLLLYAGCVFARLHQLLDQATQSAMGPQAFESLVNAKSFLWFNVIGVLVAIHFLGFFAVQHRFRFLVRAETPIRRLAGCTLSCYLFHFPLFMLFGAMLNPRPDSIGLNIVIGVLSGAVIAVLGPWAERSRYPLRSYLAEKARMFIGSEGTLTIAR